MAGYKSVKALEKKISVLPGLSRSVFCVVPGICEKVEQGDGAGQKKKKRKIRKGRRKLHDLIISLMESDDHQQKY
jgi:hypothetical protein